VLPKSSGDSVLAERERLRRAPGLPAVRSCMDLVRIRQLYRNKEIIDNGQWRGFEVCD
jgi:hypothetical protein